MQGKLAPPTAPRVMTTGVQSHASKPTIHTGSMTTGVRTRASKVVSTGAIGGSSTQIGPTGSRSFNATAGAPLVTSGGVGVQAVVPNPMTLAAILAAQKQPAAVQQRAKMKAAILQLQRWLNAQGYTCPLNGELDFATRGAISQWQANHGLPSTGALNPATIAAMSGSGPSSISTGALFGATGAGEAGSSATDDTSPTTIRRTMRVATVTHPPLPLATLNAITPSAPQGVPVVKVNPTLTVSTAHVPIAGTHILPVMTAFTQPPLPTITAPAAPAAHPGGLHLSTTNIAPLPLVPQPAPGSGSSQWAGPSMNAPSASSATSGGSQSLAIPTIHNRSKIVRGTTVMANKGNTKGWRSTGWRVALVLTASITASASATISVNPQMDFRGENLVIDSTDVGPFSTLTIPSIGTIPQIAGGPASSAVPGTLFSPAQAGALDFKMSIANQGNAVSFNANNTITTSTLSFAALLFGTEVEGDMSGGMTTGVAPAGSYQGG